MASVEHLQPDGMSPNGGRYTHVVKVGPWVFIAGQTASDENMTRLFAVSGSNRSL